MKKQNYIILGIILLVTGGVFYFLTKNKAPKQIYEVAVMVRSQKNSDPEEDKRTSLKAGDVLLTQKEGHNWSNTEKSSYLILKMNLTEEQSQKLTQGIEKSLTKDEIAQELKRFQEGREATVKQEELEQFKEELKQRRETIQMRKYHIDMSEFEGFKPTDLIKGQPYQEEIYDWGVVEEKK